ncbi:MAG: cytochrome c oxidase subunit 3 [Chitinophagaceae bacterium]|nr:cytochrome c oxidase subunit 3 [Chitinophagaceae bacterium]
MSMVSVEKNKKMHPHKFSMWVAIAGIIMMFAGLTSAMVVKSHQASWTTVEIPRIFWVSTVIILISSITMQWALRSFKQRNMPLFRLLLGITLLLGLIFVILQWLGFNILWNRYDVTFQGGGAGQFLYVIFGLHALHVLGGVIALLVLFLRIIFGKKRIYSAVPYEVMATYWHFVDLLWIYILVFFLIII